MSEKQKLIDKLTPAQEAIIPVYLEEYRKIALSTELCDRTKAEAAITDAYRYLGHKDPQFIWVDSPFEGARKAAQIAKGSEDVSPKECAEQAKEATYGSFEAYWVSFYAFIAEQLPVEKKDNLIDIVKEIVKNCGTYWTFENTVVISEKPSEIHLNAEGQLHNTDGMAIKFRDGKGAYLINGVRYKSLMDYTINKHVNADQSNG